MNLNRGPDLGFGLGLRTKHYPYIFEHTPPVDWFEIISENFMDTDGRPKRNLARIAAHYPIVMHGVSMSIGTIDPLNSEYLAKLKKLIDEVKPAWISDHLCWTGVAHKNTHDLLPLPYTEEALENVVQRIKAVQDYLERPIALENPSTYMEFSHSTLSEAEFITRMAKESGCNLLLDVNNVYVTCYNHRLDPKEYINSLPLDRVIQIHLSGHSNKGTHIVDTHDDHVIDEVWALYKYVIFKAERVPNTMIEWDDHIPEFPVLVEELDKARAAAQNPLNYNLPTFAQESSDPPVQKVSIDTLQTRMQNAILGGKAVDSNPSDWIRQKKDFPAQEQLNVYIDGYRYRLYNVVEEDYPVLKTYLGRAAFHDLIWSIVNSVHSTHFNVARYSWKLPSFIKEKHENDVVAYDIALLESQILEVGDDTETPALLQSQLENLSLETMLDSGLSLRAAARLCHFTHQVNSFYTKAIQGEVTEKPVHDDSFLAIFRHQDVVWRMDLEKAEYALLMTLSKGASIGEALEEIESCTPEELTQWFSRWMRNGLISTLNLKATHGELKNEAA